MSQLFHSCPPPSASSICNLYLASVKPKVIPFGCLAFAHMTTPSSTCCGLQSRLEPDSPKEQRSPDARLAIAGPPCPTARTLVCMPVFEKVCSRPLQQLHSWRLPKFIFSSKSMCETKTDCPQLDIAKLQPHQLGRICRKSKRHPFVVSMQGSTIQALSSVFWARATLSPLPILL